MIPAFPQIASMIPTIFGALLSMALSFGASAQDCSQSLWPEQDVAAALKADNDVREALLRQAKKAVLHPPAAVVVLRSAGVRDKTDPQLVKTRRAFRDADHAVISALAFRVSGERRYLDHARDILLHWSATNKPTGHPIDETRLEGLIWSFAVLCDQLNGSDRNRVLDYFERLYTAKQHWEFGPQTAVNNHRTHHLKLMILLDRVLSQASRLTRDRQAAELHLSNNLDPDTGVSVDYRQRDALFYHVYNLEAWLEIELLTSCCSETVDAAFRFAADRILRGETGGEFAGSTAAIDRARAEAGFDYARRDDYDVERFSRAMLVYSTLRPHTVSPELWQRVKQPEQDSRLIFILVRKLLLTGTDRPQTKKSLTKKSANSIEKQKAQ
ncbi:hypothetical protein F6455_03360 [Proteobacteria bacterium 005FR1]|nr:hypothetical protein [Proteobacteria bacterium 005FR1]